MALHKKDSLSKVPLIALLSKCFYLDDHQILTTIVHMFFYYIQNVIINEFVFFKNLFVFMVPSHQTKQNTESGK